MWLFANLLPFYIGDKVPYDDFNWHCYLLLLQVTQYCTAKIVSQSVAEFVSEIIEQHHYLFRKCYPSKSFTPKMHFMVHFPSLLLK